MKAIVLPFCIITLITSVIGVGCVVPNNTNTIDAGSPDTKTPDAGDIDAGIEEPIDPAILTHGFPRWILPIDPLASNYQDNNDGTVSDHITGLVWEKTITDSTFTQSDAIAYCDHLVLAGREDWRLPSRIELVSLVNRSSIIPASTFPEMPERDTFWSSTPFVGDTNQAWDVDFLSGANSLAIVDRNFRARCVRSEINQADIPSEQYTITNETVKDNMTGLVWQRTITDQFLTQAQAVAFCDDLVLAGASDWRLPHVLELHSIVDDTRNHPSADPTAFPDTPSQRFWSSTNNPRDASYAWNIDFSFGFDSTLGDSSLNFVNNGGRVRCVR